MTTGLLGDTSFLDTLQQASQVLNDRVSSSPFGNYTPSQASDYVVGPLGGIAQNKFMGDQFQMPNLFNAPYIPEAFNASSVLNAASTSPFNYNFGSYTPGAFSQFYGSPIASPAIARTTTRTGGGDGYENLQRFLGNRPGISNEVFGNTALRINADGTVSVIDRDTLDYKFTTGMDKLTDFGLLGLLKGDETYGESLDRIENKYGKPTADEVALNVKEQYAANQYSEPKGPSGKGPSRQASKADRDRADKGMTGGGFCFDPDTLVKMHDGTEKKIKDIKLGDQTKGGEVTGVFQFKASDEIHDYKGVTVAGSHYVKEDGKFIMVQDSPISVKIDKIPVVHSLDTTGRRIFIKDIEFADYNGDGIAKGFLANAGVDLTGFDKEVLRQVENRLI